MKLLATAGTIEEMGKLINEYYYSTTCRIEPAPNMFGDIDSCEIYNKNGLIKNVRVVKKKTASDLNK